MGSRIMAVADIFAALREKQSYRDQVTRKMTINILMDKSTSIVKQIAYENRVNEYEIFNKEIEKFKNIKRDIDFSIVN